MRVLLSPFESRVSPVQDPGAGEAVVLARPVVREPVRVAPLKMVLPVRLMLPEVSVEAMGFCEI